MTTPLCSSETWALTEHNRYRITAAEMRSETNCNIHALQPQKKARHSVRNQNATGLKKTAKINWYNMSVEWTCLDYGRSLKNANRRV
jgi:hypothetical protein